jgi:hypothetical protein
MSVVKSPALIDKLELKKTIKENKKSNEIQDPVLPKINTDNSSQSRTNTPAQMVDKPVAEVKEIPDAKGINSVNLEAMTPLNEEKKSSSTETNISVSPQNSKRDIAPDSTDEFSIEPLEIKN